MRPPVQLCEGLQLVGEWNGLTGILHLHLFGDIWSLDASSNSSLCLLLCRGRNLGLHLQSGVRHPGFHVPNAEAALDVHGLLSGVTHESPAVCPAVGMRREGPLILLVVQQIDRLATCRKPDLHEDWASVALDQLLLICPAEGLSDLLRRAHNYPRSIRGLCRSLRWRVTVLGSTFQKVLDSSKKSRLLGNFHKTAVSRTTALGTLLHQRCTRCDDGSGGCSASGGGASLLATTKVGRFLPAGTAACNASRPQAARRRPVN
mmetsp:Transcript_11186/g.25052  ORF Transcript_11186/g.25052 Transcript_11186/m.25052 type:complete len:261 (+) Transcript_11186:3443-4225(+)